MQTFLSFEPRYHELTCRDAQPVWVPIYNPVRECVERERQRIRGEFGVVDSTAWVRPVVKKIDTKELWGELIYLGLFLVGSFVLGWVMSKLSPLEGWLAVTPAEQRMAGIMAMGGAVLSLCSIVMALVRPQNTRRRSTAEEKIHER
jgi:hypothetical protein